METFVPAILSDLLGRSISFVVQRYLEQGNAEDILRKLSLALLRVRVTVEEAEGRHITNKAMLRQLDSLRQAMYAGHYMLDAAGRRHHRVHNDHQAHRFSLALPRFKRVRGGGEGATAADLRCTVDSLDTMIADMKEFVVFLGGYPRLCRQPYTAHLLLDKLMFGRQREMEHIIGFLLRPSSSTLVLPIVGLPRVGKSTLVDHVCHDDRVRNHFSSILLITGDDLDADDDANHGHDGSLRKGRSLLIVELAEDVVPDEGKWRRLCSSRENGSKIIVTSRSTEAVQRLGTEQHDFLHLEVLNREAYWYFFKVLAFGTENPDDHPKLVSIAMEIAAEEKGSFIGANIAGSMLRGNLDPRFWCSILHNMREYTQKHRYMFGKHPHDLLSKNRPVYLWRLVESSKVFMSYGCYQAPLVSSGKERITLQEVMSGKPAPEGRFEALAWRSQIPPCYSYLMTCSVETAPVVVTSSAAKKKRPRDMVA